MKCRTCKCRVQKVKAHSTSTRGGASTRGEEGEGGGVGSTRGEEGGGRRRGPEAVRRTRADEGGSEQQLSRRGMSRVLPEDGIGRRQEAEMGEQRSGRDHTLALGSRLPAVSSSSSRRADGEGEAQGHGGRRGRIWFTAARRASVAAAVRRSSFPLQT